MTQVELPESNGAERYVLTAILNESDIILDISNQITYKDFSNPFFANVFRICMQMVERSEVPEPMSIFNKLDAAGIAESKNLKDLELTRKATWDKANVNGNVEEILATSTRRKLILAQYECIAELQEKDLPPQDAVALCENKILDIGAEASRTVEVVHIGEDALDLLDGRANNPLPIAGLPTGYPELDRLLQGLQNGRLYALAARLKTGKSIFLLNVAAHVALNTGTGVLMLDTEMSSEQVQDRFLSLVSGVEETRIKNGMFSDDKDEYERLKAAAEMLKDVPIYHNYMPNFSFENCLSLAKQYKAQKNIGLVIFDYIKIPDDTDFRAVREDQSLGYLTNGFKNKIAGALNIPVLTAAQLGRRAVDSTDVSDDMIANSDRIAQFVDVVMALREKTEREKEEYGANRQTGNMILTVEASRYTDSKTVAHDLWFDKPRMKMEEKRARNRR